jgi:hypothetical protein
LLPLIIYACPLTYPAAIEDYVPMIVNDGPGHKAEIGLRVTLDDVMLPNTRFKYVYTPVCDELNV